MIARSYLLFLLALSSIMSDTSTIDAYSVGESNDHFTRAFFDVLRNEPGNLFFSPISIVGALGMVYAGANGNTEEQLRTSAFLPKTKDKAAELLGSALKSLNKADTDLTLHVANALFSDEGFTMKKDFVKLLMGGYKSEPHQVNFGDSETAAKKINAWVAEQTKDKITELVTPDSLNALTKIVLLNAIYFKGNWVHKFDAADTKKDIFHLNSKETQEVDFMNIKKSFRVARNSDLKAQIIELPYKGDAVSMIIVVPDEIEGLKEIEPKMKDINLKDLLADGSKREVQLKMPKFKMEQTIDLNDHLIKMGLSDLFNAQKADLSGIADVPLFVSKAVQKAFIEVNEEGSEAAAATAMKVRMKRSCMMMEEPQKIQVDRPFFFFVVATGVILFAGTLRNLSGMVSDDKMEIHDEL